MSRDRSNDRKVYKNRFCDLLGETRKAWKFDLEHNGTTWVPKSVCSYEPDNAYVGSTATRRVSNEQIHQL